MTGMVWYGMLCSGSTFCRLPDRQASTDLYRQTSTDRPLQIVEVSVYSMYCMQYMTRKVLLQYVPLQVPTNLSVNGRERAMHFACIDCRYCWFSNFKSLYQISIFARPVVGFFNLVLVGW